MITRSIGPGRFQGAIVVAFIAAFLAGSSSGQAAAQTRPPLSVHFAAPIPGASVSGVVPIRTDGGGGADPDGDSIVQRRYVFEIDGAVVADDVVQLPDSHQEGTVSWPSASYADGPHLFRVTVTDEAGASASAVAAYGALNHPSGAGSPDGSDVTAAVLASKPADALSGLVAVAVRADRAPDGASATLSLAVDGTVLATETVVCQMGSCMWSWVWDTTAAPNGAHTLTGTVSGIDGMETASLAVTVSNGAASGPQPVVWTSPVNVTVSGNTITKTTGCDGCADAGAASQQAIGSGGGAVEFRVSSGAQGSVGLSVGNPGTEASEIMFALRFYPGHVEVRESGAYKADWPLVGGAVHRIAVEGGAVKYYQAGLLKYTSEAPPVYPLLVDASLNAAGSSVQNAEMTDGAVMTDGAGTAPTAVTPPPGDGTAGSSSGAGQSVTWTSAVNVAVAGGTITKDGGCHGCADAGAISEQMIVSGNGSLSFTVSAGAELTAGLGTGNGGTAPGDVEFGLRFYRSGDVEVRESGAYKWDFAAIAGAVYTVAVEDGKVKYYQGGVLKYTSARPPVYPLLVDTSLRSPDAAVHNAVLAP